MNVSDILHALASLAWPILVGVIVWRLLPTMRGVIASRGFTIKAGGAEITVQQASDQLASRVEDLQEQVGALKAQSPATTEDAGIRASPIADGVPRLRQVLWVDDHPENNAYEVQALRGKNVSVVLARSTTEALQAALHARAPFDAVITDIGRTEGGSEHPQAGLELIESLRRERVDTPILVYSSAPAVGRVREQAIASGASGITSSATELLEMLGRLGLS